MNRVFENTLLAIAGVCFVVVVWVMAVNDVHAGEIPEPVGCGLPPKPKLVYTRQPRHTTPIGDYIDASNWQHVTDVGRVNGLLSEADLVLDGEVIHNCTTSDVLCVAQEARVSPNGNKIAYSVGYGVNPRPVKIWGGPMTDMVEFQIVRAEIWVYVVDAGKKYRITAGFIDRTPDWIDNQTLVFASDRAATYAPLLPAGNYYPFRSLQIHKMQIGRDPVNLTPHALMALSPALLTGGGIFSTLFGTPAPPFAGRNPPPATAGTLPG